MVPLKDRMYCRLCIYRARSGHDENRPWLCEYILMTGKPRGCPPGEGCEKRKTRKKRTA